MMLLAFVEDLLKLSIIFEKFFSISQLHHLYLIINFIDFKLVIRHSSYIYVCRKHCCFNFITNYGLIIENIKSLSELVFLLLKNTGPKKIEINFELRKHCSCGKIHRYFFERLYSFDEFSIIIYSIALLIHIIHYFYSK